MAPFRPRRHADDDRPVELLGLAVAEGVAQPPGRQAGAGDQQQARRVLVQAVDQPRPLLVAETQRVEHAVDMPLGPGPALHRQARRLVQHDDLVVLVDDQAADLLGVAVRHGRDLARLGWRRRGDAGRQADGLAGLDAILALGALAVDADLAGAQKLLQGAVAQLGEMALEPAVEPQAGLVVDDGSGLDLGVAHGVAAFTLPPPSYGGGGPQGRRGKAPEAMSERR